MAIIQGGTSPDLLAIDHGSSAARVTLYDTKGNAWTAVPVSGALTLYIATPVGVSGTISFATPLAVSGTVSVGNSPAVSQTAGPWAVSGTVTIGNAPASATIAAPLAVSGSITVASGAIAVTNLVQVSGAISASNVVQVSGAIQINPTTSGQTIDSYLAFSGLITPGGSTSGTIITGTTPTATQRLRINGFTFGCDQAAKINLTFHDGCKVGGGTIVAYATMGASTSTPTVVDFGTGILLSTGNSLYIAVDTAATITGVILGHFE